MDSRQRCYLAVSRYPLPAMNQLLLPGEPGFQETLFNARTLFKPKHNTAFIARPGSNGLMVPVSGAELREYLLGGEYDERMNEIQEDVDE